MQHILKGAAFKNNTQKGQNEMETLRRRCLCLKVMPGDGFVR